jgi:hypothetical protein
VTDGIGPGGDEGRRPRSQRDRTRLWRVRRDLAIAALLLVLIALFGRARSHHGAGHVTRSPTTSVSVSTTPAPRTGR